MLDRRIARVLAAVVALAGCPLAGPEGPADGLPACDPVGAISRRQCAKEWTILMIVAADAPDLTPHAYADLQELEAGLDPALAAEIDVLVHLDVDDPPGIRRLALGPAMGPPAGPIALDSPVIAAFADESAPAPEQYADFIEWSLREHPSRAVALIVWGHGQGWRGRGEAAPVAYDPRRITGGIAFDQSPPGVVDVPTLGDRIGEATAAANGGRPLDLLILDACLMQSAEVDLEFAERARYIVGHEQIDPYAGLPYGAALPLLVDAVTTRPGCEPGDRPCVVAARLPELYRERASIDLDAIGAETFSISAVASEPLRGRLQPALDELGRALLAYLDEDPLRAIEVQELLSPRSMPGFFGGTRDLAVVVDRFDAWLGRAPETPAAAPVRAALARTREALAGAVIAAASGGAPIDVDPVARAVTLAGLSIWLPHTPEEHAARGPSHRDAPLHDGPWGIFLERVFAAPAP